MSGRLVRDVLAPALRERPDAEAVRARSGSLTYRELDDAADRAAGALWSLGVRPGDRVAAGLPNDLDVVVAFHGAMRVGAVWVGVGEALAPPEREHLLRDSAASVVLAPPDVTARVERAALPALRHAVAVSGSGEWPALLAAGHRAGDVALDPHSPAGIAYTSGTTGTPKGVVHSQHNLLLPGAVLVAERGWGPELRKGDCLPLTILNLMVLTTLLTAQAQGCCVVMDRRDPDGVLAWLTGGGITVWNGVPAQLYDLARRPDATPALLGDVTEVWNGGADCPQGLRDEFAAAYGRPVRATYGLTEAPTVVAIDPAGADCRPGASGRVLGHLAVRAYSPDGDALPPGEVGELALSAAPYGPWAGEWTPALGVWRGDRVEPWPAGPTFTGDLGSVDAEGWLRVLDRRKLVVVRGGANVYPAEVERVLLTCDGVRGAAVFGVPDERLGERVAALVEPVPGAAVTADDLAAACRAQLARYKVPERWGVVDALPRNAMGKVVRPALPALLAPDAAPAP